MEKILIVDDEMFSRTAIEDILRAEWSSIEVFSARGASEALGILEREEIDLLMTDIKMPGMNGLELLAEVRRRGLCSSLPCFRRISSMWLKRRCRNSGKRAAAGSRNLTERGFPETENSFFGIS